MGALSAIYMAVFLLGVPWLAIRSHRAILAGHPLPSRSQLFIQIIVMQVLFAAFSLLYARRFRIPLFPPFELHWSAVLAALVVFVLMLVIIPLRWGAATPELKRRLMHTRPQSMSDMGAWTVVSLAAGIGEEITYRGVLFSMLWHFTGSAWAAALISASAFAVGHALQGWRAGTVVFFFALAVQGIVWLAGSLYIAMILHFVYDLAAGFMYMRLCRDGEVQPPPPQPA